MNPPSERFCAGLYHRKDTPPLPSPVRIDAPACSEKPLLPLLWVLGFLICDRFTISDSSGSPFPKPSVVSSFFTGRPGAATVH